jgi:hypothetical protein
MARRFCPFAETIGRNPVQACAIPETLEVIEKTQKIGLYEGVATPYRNSRTALPKLRDQVTGGSNPRAPTSAKYDRFSQAVGNVASVASKAASFMSANLNVLKTGALRKHLRTNPFVLKSKRSKVRRGALRAAI